MSNEKIDIWESGIRWLWISALVILADQYTKYLIVSHMYLGETIYLAPVLDFFRTTNTGAGFSAFADWGGSQRWFLSALAIIVSVVLVYWLRKLLLQSHQLLSFGLVLIVGGAVGNVIDRLRLGHVVDFVLAHWGDAKFPAFNVADAAITIGAVLVALDALRDARRDRAAARANLTK